jgi:hypothetical protein
VATICSCHTDSEACPTKTIGEDSSVGFSLRGFDVQERKIKCAQAEAYATGGDGGSIATTCGDGSSIATGGGDGSSVATVGGEGVVAPGGGALVGSIHFDSVDGALEAAVLRHVAKFAAAAVIVDRPGGVVHSERELRIILPVTGNAKADEAAAVAVEFGVLRGMLDLVTPPAANLTDKSAVGSGGAQSGGKKNLWTMFRQAARAARSRSGVILLAGALLAGALLAGAGRSHASLRPGLREDRVASSAVRLSVAKDRAALPAGRPNSSSGRRATPIDTLALPASKFTLTALRLASPASRRVVEARGIDGAYLHLEAALAPAPAEGQFAAGELNIALIGGAAVSSSLYDSGNTALKVNCVVGCGATSTFSDNAAFSAGSTAVNNISAVFNDSIAALTSGNAGAVRSTSDRMLYVNVGKLGGTALSGANVVDSGNTAFRVNCVVGCSATAGFTDNSAFTAGTTTETSVGGVYNDGLSTLSSGNGAAARITASRALHVNLRNSSGTEIGTSSNPVRIDPVGTTTQPVSWSGQSVSLTGTLPAFASTPAVNVSQLAGTTLGAPSAYGTSPGAVNVPGVNAYVTNSPNVALNSGSNTIGSVKVTDGTNTVVVDPCKGQTKNFVSINQTANTQLAAGTASKKIYICSIHVVVAAATNVALVEGTGSVCATGTAGVSGFGGATAATGWNFAANAGIALGNGDSSLGAEGTAADNLCVYNSGSGQVSGGVSYVVQ